MKSELCRSAVLTGYADLAREAGLDPVRMATAEGLPAACLIDPEMRVSFHAAAALLEESARRAAMPEFGMRMAEVRRLSHLGVVGLLARERPTVRAALETVRSLFWMLSEGLSITLEEKAEIAIVALHHQRRAGGERQIMELSVAIVAQALRTLIGRTWRPQAVLFTYAAPPDLTTHRRILGVQPAFGQEIDGIVVASGDLDVALPGADPEFARVLDAFVAQAAARRPADFVGSVRELVTEMLAGGDASAERVATRLGMDPRTLHRQLAVRGASLRGIVEDLRAELVESHFRQGDRSLTEISERVGFSSLSAFSRWHRHRYGVAASVRQAELARPR